MPPFEHAAQTFDVGARLVGEVAQGVLTDLAILAVALARKRMVGGEFLLGTASIYIAEYGHIRPQRTSFKFYIAWQRSRLTYGIFLALSTV